MLVDVDRHMLTGIVGHNKVFKAKLGHLHKEILLGASGKKEGNYIKMDKFCQSLISHSAKQEALLTHLVSLIKQFDTGKGTESGDITVDG